ALPNVGSARYQAVFLSNGQTYFGRFIDRIGPYVKIEKAYYIQTNQTDDPSTPPESRLIKRGNELHQPLPYVLIPRTAILYFDDARKTTTDLSVGLLKRGTELHAPADGMRIRRDKVLAIERVGLDSPVARAIEAQRAIDRGTAK